VMFDADGVLFDSTESNVAYYNWIFAKVGEAPLDRDGEIAAVSYAASEVFAARARGDAAKLGAMHAVTRNMDQTPFFKMLRPPFELRPFMLDLKRRYKLGLATNRSATVPALVEHLDLGGVFDAVASALDKVRPKPAAESAGTHFIGVGSRIEHDRLIATIADLQAALELLAATRT